MSLIWNNQKCEFVKQQDNWDRLEFIIARKIHVQYVPEQVRSYTVKVTELFFLHYIPSLLDSINQFSQRTIQNVRLY